MKTANAAAVIGGLVLTATVVSLHGQAQGAPKAEVKETHSHSATGIHSVKEYAVPPCENEDGSGGQGLPCRWDAHVRGNGVGLSYVILKDGHIRYDKDQPDPAGTRAPIWMVTADGEEPSKANSRIGEAYEVGIQDHWVWLKVNTQFADALAEGGSAHADKRQWEDCVYSPVVLVCPDGYVENL